MNDKMKTVLIVVGAVIAVAFAGFMGWNTMRDNSQPVDSPSYAKLSPEERERIRREGLARRNGQRLPAPSNSPTPVP